MTDQTATATPEFPTLRQNLARIPSPDNIILRIPTKQLPRLRTTLILFHLILIIAGIAKLFWLGIPGSHMFLFLLDLIFGTPIIILFTLLAAWGHTRDIHEKFQIEQLRVIPHGDQLLARALALRPLNAILLPLTMYYFASLLFGCLNILPGFGGHNGFVVGVAICLIILAFQFPWVLIMTGLMVSITANTVRAVTKTRGTMPTILIEAFGRLLIAMIVLIIGVFLVITFVTGFAFPDTDLEFLIPVAFVVFVVVIISIAVGLAVTSWVGDALERLDTDLQAHWSESPLPYHEPPTITS